MKLITGMVMLCATALDTTAQDLAMAHSPRVAFYEAAPRSLATSMMKAVRHACRDQASGILGQGESSWLCSGTPLRYFRGVDVLGNKQWTGLVCASSSVTPNLKYYTEDMFEGEAECAALSYSVQSRTHELAVDD